MNIRPHRKIVRKKTRKITVGNVTVGGDSKISVQSMTNTLTTEVKNTINQIKYELVLSKNKELYSYLDSFFAFKDNS